jgi:hypothetical protein
MVSFNFDEFNKLKAEVEELRALVLSQAKKSVPKAEYKSTVTKPKKKKTTDN